jgi:Cysteine rich repeat
MFNSATRLSLLLAGLVATTGFSSTAGAQAISPEMRSEPASLMQICRGDYDRFCGDVTPGGGRILACLQNHAAQLSPACATAMPRAEALKNSAINAGVLPK